MDQIEICGKPIPWKRAGVHGFHFYDRQLEEKQRFRDQLKKAYHKAPQTGSITLNCVFSFSPAKSLSNRKRIALVGKSHNQRPDADNLVKFVNDAAQGILWEDDCQISKLIVEKVWGAQDKTTIYFEGLANEKEKI